MKRAIARAGWWLVAVEFAQEKDHGGSFGVAVSHLPRGSKHVPCKPKFGGFAFIKATEPDKPSATITNKANVTSVLIHRDNFAKLAGNQRP